MADNSSRERGVSKSRPTPRRHRRVRHFEDDVTEEEGEGKSERSSDSCSRSISEESSSRIEGVLNEIARTMNFGCQPNEAAPAHGSGSLPSSNISAMEGNHPSDSINAGGSNSDPIGGRQSSELNRGVSEEVMDLREAVQSGKMDALEMCFDKRTNIRQELMAQNAVNGAGLLMLSVTTGNVVMLKRIAAEIKTRLGTALLAKHLRYKNDMGMPIMFLAAKSSLMMFQATTKLVRKSIGKGGLIHQLRHRCPRGMNILMMACTAPGVFKAAKNLVKQADCLEELLEDKDGRERDWILHAAEAGNLDVLDNLETQQQDVISELFSAVDNNGWNIFMYAARGKNVDFLIRLRKLCVDQSFLMDQLRQEADDKSTILMHAAIGGFESYTKVYEMIQETGCMDQNLNDKSSVLLSWASKGGDVRVLNAVANGVKSGSFSNGVQGDNDWFVVSHNDEAARLSRAIMVCAECPETSLFLCAVESDSIEMIDAVLKGMNVLFQDAKERWKMLCGHKGNPLTVAATRSVEYFQKTLEGLKKVAQTNILGLLLPETPETNRSPLCNAVLSENPLVFDKILMTVEPLRPQHLKAKEILDQVKYAMRGIQKKKRFSEEWISARMLANVLQAVKEAEEFNLGLLDDFVLHAVSIRAFDHIRELIQFGCNLVTHFPKLIFKVAKNEPDTTEGIMLAITASSNPFIECGIASQWIHEAEKRGLNHAALDRLRHHILDLTLELLENLPRSVIGVGEELARDDPDLDHFQGHIIGKIRPSELLGFIVVGGMLDGDEKFNVLHRSQSMVYEGPLAQAIRLGPRALDLLSQPLVMDYLRLKFSRALPRWNDQKPFQRNINQTFYSYKYQGKESRNSDKRSRGDVFQLLLLFLQGWKIEGKTLPHRAVLPGMQFTLAGIMGKPSSYYVVPAIRMFFVVFNYIATIGVYLSCVSLRSQRIPPNEWLFYILMLSVAWRETIEFWNVLKLEKFLETSIVRYFNDKWNFLDVITLCLVFTTFLFRMMELATEIQLYLIVAQFFFAATAPLLLSRVLFLSQAGSALGPMMQVIFTMLKELMQFSVVLVLVLIGFAVSFQALYGKHTVFVERNFDDCDVRDHPIVEAFGTIQGALLTLFQYMLGEFNFDLFDARYETADGEDCGSVIYQEFGLILMAAYIIITAVMLLNLLIAVLITAHSKVQQNASKEFQLARAKIILLSEDDVLRDVLPPPFNLVKPVLGIFWPASSKGDQSYDLWWEITIGAIHRIIFWLVMGLGALIITIVLWMTSIPLRAWKIYQRQKFHLSSKTEETSTEYLMGSRPSTNREDATSTIKDLSRERLSPGLALGQLKEGFNMLVPILLATGLCLVVYPLLSIVLWLRGFGDVLEYIKEMRNTSDPQKRRRLDLGKGEEWSIAREHAITKNNKYSTANPSTDVFNVNTLLKTTTGMTMEDLRQDMVRSNNARRRRVFMRTSGVGLSKNYTEESVGEVNDGYMF